MSFGENLQYLRKRENLTQENLAEQMEVSRQTISKWEACSSYPEMEKLLQLCELFSCTMDDLMRGNMEEAFSEDLTGYDMHMNRFCKQITAGVMIIVAGAGLFMLLDALGLSENMVTAAFMLFVLAGVTDLVIAGMQHSHFQAQHPRISMIYSKEEVDDYNGRKFPVFIAGGIAIILGGVIVMLILNEVFGNYGIKEAEDLANGIFLFLVAAGAGMVVYGGIQKSKYDIEEYNKSQNPTEEEKKRNRLIGAWCGVIMMAATIIYLVGGFRYDGFGTWWVVYPAGGILCGIAAVIINRNAEE